MSINLNSSIFSNTSSGNPVASGLPETNTLQPFNGTNSTTSISGGDSSPANGNGAFNPLLFVVPVSVGRSNGAILDRALAWAY